MVASQDLSEAIEMEMLDITDYDVYQRQPQAVLVYRRAFRAERARLEQMERDRARAGAGR